MSLAVHLIIALKSNEEFFFRLTSFVGELEYEFIFYVKNVKNNIGEKGSSCRTSVEINKHVD